MRRVGCELFVPARRRKVDPTAAVRHSLCEQCDLYFPEMGACTAPPSKLYEAELRSEVVPTEDPE